MIAIYHPNRILLYMYQALLNCCGKCYRTADSYDSYLESVDVLY